MNNPLFRLMDKYRQGDKPTFHLGPFLPLLGIKDKGLFFNEIMKDTQPMTEAALRISARSQELKISKLL